MTTPKLKVYRDPENTVYFRPVFCHPYNGYAIVLVVNHYTPEYLKELSA